MHPVLGNALIANEYLLLDTGQCEDRIGLTVDLVILAVAVAPPLRVMNGSQHEWYAALVREVDGSSNQELPADARGVHERWFTGSVRQVGNHVA